MEGEGKYDELCTFVRIHTMAIGAIVVVLGGDKGSGFSMQMSEDIGPKVIAGMLRSVADEVEREAATRDFNK